jgi:hypothetical protein
MVDPAVLEAVGYDPTKYSGFAAGFGVERFAMIMHQISGECVPTPLNHLFPRQQNPLH